MLISRAGRVYYLYIHYLYVNLYVNVYFWDHRRSCRKVLRGWGGDGWFTLVSSVSLAHGIIRGPSRHRFPSHVPSIEPDRNCREKEGSPIAHSLPVLRNCIWQMCTASLRYVKPSRFLPENFRGSGIKRWRQTQESGKFDFSRWVLLVRYYHRPTDANGPRLKLLSWPLRGRKRERERERESWSSRGKTSGEY